MNKKICILGSSESYNISKCIFTDIYECFDNSCFWIKDDIFSTFDIIDYSSRNGSIDFYQFCYNFDKDFFKNINNSDLLIWELNKEPRKIIFLNDSNEKINLLDNNYSKYINKSNISSWKKETLNYYFKNLYNNRLDIEEKKLFLEYIIELRSFYNKKTIIIGDINIANFDKNHIFNIKNSRDINFLLKDILDD